MIFGKNQLEIVLGEIFKSKNSLWIKNHAWMTGAWRTGAGRRGPAGPGDGARQKKCWIKKSKNQTKHSELKITAWSKRGPQEPEGLRRRPERRETGVELKKIKKSQNHKNKNHGLLGGEPAPNWAELGKSMCKRCHICQENHESRSARGSNPCVTDFTLN